MFLIRKTNFFSTFLLVACLVSLLSCSSNPSTNPGTTTTEKSEEPADSLKLEAFNFDSYLRGTLSAKDNKAYQAQCMVENPASPFCFSVREQDRLDRLYRLTSKKRSPRISQTPARIKFSKSKITNWQEVRYASVSSLIKRLQLMDSAHVEGVHTYAMNEKRCPNNAALAVATQLEDLLPDEVHASDIAKVYEKAAHCPLDKPDTVEMVWTRSGLFHVMSGRPQEALKAFKNATETKASFLARSLYWLYKMQLETADYKGAQSTLQTLRESYPFSFHTLIALTNRNEDPGKILEQTGYSEKKRSASNEEVNKLLEQIELLHKYGFHNSAARVLDWALALAQAESEPELMIYFSDLKEVQGDHVSKISLLSDVLYANPGLISRATMEKYFPKPFFPLFEKNSEGLDPFLLLAVARRESAFNPKAVSSANAQGLLQITPQTLRTISTRHDLFDPSSNVNAGARLLGDLIRGLNGQIHLALAAYNAGSKRVTTWNARYPVEDPILFIDLIPFKETREYVAAVLRNYYWYQKLNTSNSHLSPREILQYKSIEVLPTSANKTVIRPNRNVPE